VMHAFRNDFADWGVVDNMEHLSFWHDDLSDQRDRVKYRRRIARLRALAEPQRGDSSGRHPLVFARAANATVELLKAEELLRLLETQFGSTSSKTHARPVYLLLIFDRQPSTHTFFFANCSGLIVQCVGFEMARTSGYDIDRPPFCTAYREPIIGAIWHATVGWRPSSSTVLQHPRDLVFAPQVFWHQSLGEDIRQANYHYGIPQMPPKASLKQVLCSRASREVRHIVSSSLWAHFRHKRAEGGIVTPSFSDEPQERSSGDLVLWAALLAKNVLSFERP